MTGKSMAKSAWICAIVLGIPVSLYFAFVSMLLLKHAIPISLLLLIAAAFFLLLMAACRFFGAARPIQPSPVQLNPRKVFLIAFTVCFLNLLVYLWGFFPGGFSPDTLYQWRQIHGETPLTDWHPALHTLMLYVLTRIWDHPTFPLVLQLLAYAGAVGYCASVMAEHRVPRLLICLSVLYMSFSPSICNLMLFLWKDCAFSICMLILCTQLFQQICTDGTWICKNRNLAALSMMLCLCSILRHNGPAFTIPAAIWLVVSYKRQIKRVLLSLGVCLILYALIKGPLYTAVHVEPSDSGLDEVFGVPMTVLSNVYAEAPDSLDADIVEYLEDVTPYETYKTYNTTGDWNNIKWAVGKVYTVRPYSLIEVFSFALRAWRAEPDLAVEALAYLWQMPMWPLSDAYWRISPYDVGIAATEISNSSFLEWLLNGICRYSAVPALAWLFWLPGFYMAILTALCVIFAPHRRLDALLLPAGLIPYHLATSLFLSSSTDFRFYLGFMICMPVCLTALLITPDRKNFDADTQI